MRASSRQALIGFGAVFVVLAVIVVLASNANSSTGLRADVLSARRTEPGTVEPFTISVRDTKGRVKAVTVDFGDGRVEHLDVPPASCRVPLSQDFTVKHAFAFTGFSTITATVETGACGARTERVEAIRTIEVRTVRR